MGEAKSIRVEPISATDANRIVRDVHYSGKVDTRSQLHFGVFMGGRCGGAIQLGPPIDKRKALGAVRGAKWHDMLDLHRLAFADWLPRNSESRAISVMLRCVKKAYPCVRWVQSYADAAQCGDGAIYRASGFSLIGIKPNTSMYRMPGGEVCCNVVFQPGFQPNAGPGSVKAKYGKTGSETAGRFLRRIGAERLPGFQLRYIYFLDPDARKDLAVPEIPFSEIKARGAAMYRGKKQRAGSIVADASAIQAEEGGSVPTPALHSKAAAS